MKISLLVLKLWLAMFRGDTVKIRALVVEMDRLRNGHGENNHVERR